MNNNFFNNNKKERSQLAEVMAKIAGGGLHLAAITFLLYSGYHGVSASLGFAGTSNLAKIGQIVGIVTNELVLLSLYISIMNEGITGAYQTVAAAVTMAIGFAFSSLGIVADSQLHAGGVLSIWLAVYLQWLLPLSPVVTALGAFFVHMMAPDKIQARREANQQQELEQVKFDAYIAEQKAEMNIAKIAANLQLNARLTAARQVEEWYSGEEAQQAITQHALTNAPALLASIGMTVAPVDKAAAELFKPQAVRLQESAPDAEPLILEQEEESDENF